MMLLSFISGVANGMRSPAVEVSSVRISSAYSINYVETDVTNVSDKQIAYLTLDYYYYDRMGTYQCHEERTYTGPLDPQHCLTLNNAPMVADLGAVWPKTIKVEYTDGGEESFSNPRYYCTNDYYGGVLKEQ